ncbi:diguanylate cyclase [Marivita sp. S0852]|uniref:GGDEF domain-containing response regulator n=1 Tax=Marivita sp. S0852 TaxID=3373893 RepID=UPI003982CC7C
MAGHVLIIDALSNRRIQLCAQLDREVYAVEVAATLLEGLTRIQENPPEIAILAYDLPGLKLPQLCKKLRSNTQTQLTTVVVAVPCENHSARVSALTAGAHDLVEYGADRSDLRARIRSIMRDRHGFADTMTPAPMPAALGLAEAAAPFQGSVRTTVVHTDPNLDRDGQIAALEAVNSLSICTSSALEARRAPEPDTDVFILYEDGLPDEARDTLLALRSHPVSRDSSVLFVTENDIHVPSPLDLGADDHLTVSAKSPELILRVQRLAQRKREKDKRRKAVNALGELVYTDALTNLNNRRFADDFLNKLDRASEHRSKALAILLLDVDHFKRFNDTHGHPIGDAILAHIASVLSDNVRKGDMLARFGGEEFIVALPGVVFAEAHQIAERLRKAVADTPLGLDEGPHVRPTMSIGLAYAGKMDRKTTSELTRAADAALYRAKQSGRNRLSSATAEDFLVRKHLPPAGPSRNIG